MHKAPLNTSLKRMHLKNYPKVQLSNKLIIVIKELTIGGKSDKNKFPKSEAPKAS